MGLAEARYGPQAMTKTVMCRNFTGVEGSCKYGDRCTFAHYDTELGSPRGPFSHFQDGDATEEAPPVTFEEPEEEVAAPSEVQPNTPMLGR